MRSQLTRPGVLFTALLALVPPRSSSPVASAAGGAQRGGDRPRLLGTPIFPYPEALQLLDVLDGAQLAAPSSDRQWRPRHQGTAIPFPKGRHLLDEVLSAGDAALDLLMEMYRACRQAADPLVAPNERARQEEIYRSAFLSFAKLQETTEFEGELLDGSRDVLLVRPPEPDFLFVDLPDWRPETLDLWSRIPGLSSAQAALNTIDEALYGVERDRVRLLVRRQELVEGSPNGGLGEIERLLVRMRELALQASDGTLNTTDRVLLQIRQSSDLARINPVAFATRFDGTQLLFGGQVGLQGQLGTTLVFDLPYVERTSLGLSGADITNLTNAAAVYETLSEALLFIGEQRSAVHEARDALENGFLLLR